MNCLWNEQPKLPRITVNLCIENQIEVQEELSSLLTLINGWITYYPTIKGRSKMLIGEIVLQESTTIE